MAATVITEGELAGEKLQASLGRMQGGKVCQNKLICGLKSAHLCSKCQQGKKSKFVLEMPAKCGRNIHLRSKCRLVCVANVSSSSFVQNILAECGRNSSFA